jgi:hypothetical protein
MMPTRTTTRTVTFARPFLISGMDQEGQAGTYVIETYEERVEPLSFAAYRRISTSIRLSQPLVRPGIVETYVIDPGALEAALVKDAADG